MPNWFFKVMSSIHVGLYRATKGRLGGRMVGCDVCLLTTTGSKTGIQRTAPLLCFPEPGDKLVIIASKGGADKAPAWWGNLQKNPRAEVEYKGARKSMAARQASPEEKARLWPMVVERYAGYAEYQKKTTRDIPVVILEPSN